MGKGWICRVRRFSSNNLSGYCNPDTDYTMALEAMLGMPGVLSNRQSDFDNPMGGAGQQMEDPLMWNDTDVQLPPFGPNERGNHSGCRLKSNRRNVYRVRPCEKDHRDQPFLVGHDGRWSCRLHVLGTGPLKAVQALRTKEQGKNQRGGCFKASLKHMLQLQRHGSFHGYDDCWLRQAWPWPVLRRQRRHPDRRQGLLSGIRKRLRLRRPRQGLQIRPQRRGSLRPGQEVNLSRHTQGRCLRWNRQSLSHEGDRFRSHLRGRLHGTALPLQGREEIVAMLTEKSGTLLSFVSHFVFHHQISIK